MTDELAIPQVPEAAADDPEDVSWALSTAEAMWARGDHSEGIKWVRRAAEAASEAENDTRALELAKAAADLAGLISRMSKSAFGDDIGATPAPPPVPMSKPRSAPPLHKPASAPPAKPISAPPIPPGPASVTKVVATPSRSAPLALPSKASQPPPNPVKSPPRAPLATPTRPGAPIPSRAGLSSRPPESTRKGRRKSRENLEADARDAGVFEGGPLPAAGAALLPNDTTEIAAATVASNPRTSAGMGQVRARAGGRQEADATVIANVDDLMGTQAVARTTDEWDASPTQNIDGDRARELIETPERATRVGSPPSRDASRSSGKGPAAAPSRPARAPAPTKHDPEIVTSQAVRVVVWRDSNGVHVAPAGTVVSAITVDAVLVALEEGADLTAWLSQRG